MLIIRKPQQKKLFTAARKGRQDLRKLIPRIVKRLDRLKFIDLYDSTGSRLATRGLSESTWHIVRLSEICSSVYRDVVMAGCYNLYKEDSLVQFAGYRFLLGPGWLKLKGVLQVLENNNLDEYAKTTQLSMAVESALD